MPLSKAPARPTDQSARRFMEAMTKIVTGQPAVTADVDDPLTPVAFHMDGLDFVSIPPTVPLPWKEKDS
jgi:hypothetical protein